jgi:ATP-dependent Lon protease
MIGECLAEDREFGVVCIEDNEIKKIGSTARVERIVKRYEDGRMDILTRGDKRFLIRMTYDDRPYLQAKVIYFDDEAEDRSEEIDELTRKGIELLTEFGYMTGEREDYTPLLEFDRKTISFWISNCRGFTIEEKQRLLEMTSTSARIRKSVSALKKIVDRMKIAREIERVTGGNGNLRKLDV